MPCPRCGHVSNAGGGPFCPQCGRYLATLQWVAEPPPSAGTPPPVPRPVRYVGPPRYTTPPRWGFPAAPWRAAPGPPAPVPPERMARSLAAVAVPLLWALVAVALLAAGAEIWRYVLLLASREGALSADAVAASDALVVAAGSGTVLLGLVAGGLVVAWSLRAAMAAAGRSGSRPSRSLREIVLGCVVPGWNLVVAGPVLAEIEHGALDRPPGRRPEPSRLIRVWWLLWVVGGVLAAVVLAWSWRAGVQARADGVALHAVVNLVAAVTAGVTAVLVSRLTALLNPVRAPRRLLLAVDHATVRRRPGAPATPA